MICFADVLSTTTPDLSRIYIYQIGAISVSVFVDFDTVSTGNIKFSALFSYMLWHIELKFCIWPCFSVLHIKVECRHFASIIMAVISLFELRIFKIHSFSHFSFTCFDTLSWTFAYNFVFCTTDQVRVSLICVNL